MDRADLPPVPPELAGKVLTFRDGEWVEPPHVYSVVAGDELVNVNESWSSRRFDGRGGWIDTEGYHRDGVIGTRYIKGTIDSGPTHETDWKERPCTAPCCARA